MKIRLLTLLLVLTLTAPLHAQDGQEPVEQDNQITISIHDDEASNQGTDKDETVKIKVGSLKQLILDRVEKKLADADISMEEKSEIEDELDLLEQELDKLGDLDININGDLGEEGVMPFLVAITAIIVIFGTPFLIVAAVLWTSYRKRRLMHDTITQYVSSGKDVPPEVLNSLEFKPSSPKTNLHKGLVMCGIGIGIFLCFMMIGSPEAASFGLIPLFIGLAQLLIWKLEDKKGE